MIRGKERGGLPSWPWRRGMGGEPARCDRARRQPARLPAAGHRNAKAASDHADGHPNHGAFSHPCCRAQRDRHGYTHAPAEPYTHAEQNAYSNLHSRINSIGDEDGDGNTHSNEDCYEDFNSLPNEHADSDIHSNKDIHSDKDIHTNTVTNSYLYTYTTPGRIQIYLNIYVTP